MEMKIHDMRNGKSAPSDFGDIVIYDNRPGFANVAQIRGNGNRQQLWLLNVVSDDEADMMLQISEWCEPCHDAGKFEPAVSYETSNRGDLFTDCYRCVSCTHERNKQEHEDAVWYSQQEIADYQRTLADFEAGTGRI